MKTIRIAVALLLILCFSCRKETVSNHNIRIVCDTDGMSVKSTLNSDVLYRINDLNLFIYDSGGTLVESYYQSGSSCVSAIFPDAEALYDVFVIANTGVVEAPVRESDMAGIIYKYTDYTTLKESGLPMAGLFKGYNPEKDSAITIRRLAALFEITFDNVSSKADYTIKSGRLCNCALDIYPFSEGTAATSVLQAGDEFSAEDISALNRGEPVVLYTLENEQGVLLPGNSDPKKKVPSSLPAENACLCTYLEVTADVHTATTSFTDAHFRVYLGEDLTTDFNVRRNRFHYLELDFESDMVEDDGWRTEADDPEIEGSISMSKRVAEVMDGIDDVIYIYPHSDNGKEMGIVLQADDSELESAALSYVTEKVVHDGRPAIAVYLSSEHPIDALNDYVTPPDALKVHFSVTSDESLHGEPTVTSSFEVNVYHEVFPIYLQSYPYGGYMDMYAYSNNPFGTAFSGNISYRMGQQTGGYNVKFDNVIPSRSGAFLGRYSTYGSAGTWIDVRMKPVINGVPVDMYMGESSKICFGPGTALSPGNMESVSDGVEWHVYEGGFPSLETNTGFFLMFNTINGSAFIINDSCSGWNNQNLYSFDKFTGCPFYFMNGGLQVVAYYAYNEEPRYLDDSARVGFEVVAYEPGRDLEFNAGTPYTSYYTVFGALMGIMTQFWGNTHIWMDWQSYDYHTCLTINGCSCWAGAASGMMGCSLRI